MRRGLLKEYSSTVGYLHRIVDCCIGVVSGFLAYAIYPGIYPINEYYLGTLYGAPWLNYHYDWIVHSVGFAMYALACSALFYKYLKKRKKWKQVKQRMVN